MSEYPCIICQNGDVYSNVICDDCQDDIDFFEEVYDSIRIMISRLNNISGYLHSSLSSEIDRLTYDIHQQIYKAKIEWIEKNGIKELVKDAK